MKGIGRYLFRGLAISIASVVVMISFNNVRFLHYHYAPDGSLLKHAHPYLPSSHEDSPAENHHHSGLELLLLDGLFKLAFEANSSSVLFTPGSGEIVYCLGQIATTQCFVSVPRNKAPPAC